MTISNERRFSLALACKTLALLVCAAMAIGGKHPPLRAQQGTLSEPWMISNEDAVQDSTIAAINKHLEHTDNQVDREDTRIQETQSQLSEMQGEERFAFGLLTVLTGGSIAFQLKRRSSS